MARTATRSEYVAVFEHFLDSVKEAMAFETSMLSVADEFLPDFAQAVKREPNAEPDPRYFGWLLEMLEGRRNTT